MLTATINTVKLLVINSNDRCLPSRQSVLHLPELHSCEPSEYFQPSSAAKDGRQTAWSTIQHNNSHNSTLSRNSRVCSWLCWESLWNPLPWVADHQLCKYLPLTSHHVSFCAKFGSYSIKCYEQIAFHSGEGLCLPWTGFLKSRRVALQVGNGQLIMDFSSP